MNEIKLADIRDKVTITTSKNSEGSSITFPYSEKYNISKEIDKLLEKKPSRIDFIFEE